MSEEKELRVEITCAVSTDEIYWFLSTKGGAEIMADGKTLKRAFKELSKGIKVYQKYLQERQRRKPIKRQGVSGNAEKGDLQ